MQVNAESGPTRSFLSGLLSLLVFSLALLALQRVLSEFAWADVRAELDSLATLSLTLSLLATMASYALLTPFDWIAVRLSGKAVPFATLVQTAFVANALGHNLGMAALTGGTVRARAYADHGLTATDIGNVIASATFGFLVGVTFWLGCALMAESDYASQALHAPDSALRVGGAGLLLSLTIGLALLSSRSRECRIFGHTLRLPARRDALAMLAASVLELACAAAALYALLPPDADVTYLAFVGLYVIAVVAGAVSSVPAGLGVFEATMLLMLPRVSAHTLLAAILAYRIVYYLLPLLFALGLLGLRSMRQSPRALGRRMVAVRRWTDPLVAPAFAALVFAAGAALVINGSLPLNLDADAQIAHTVALPVLELSHMAASALGVVFLILASGVYQRIHLAWLLSVAGLGLATVLTLVAGVRWPLTLAAVGLMSALWSARRRFYRNPALLDSVAGVDWLRNILLVIAAAAWLGFLVHRNVEYDHDLWWQFAFESDAPRMLRALLVSVLVLTMYGFMRLLRPGTARPMVASAAERDRAAVVVARVGRADAHLALVPDKQLLFAPDDSGLLMYQRSGPYLIAMGDPIGPAPVARALAWQLRELADRAGLATVFYQVCAENLPIYLDMGLTLSKLGEDAVVSLADFSLDGPKRAELRQEHRRAQRDGAVFAMLSPEEVRQELPRLRSISDQWLEDKETAEKRFSLGYFDDSYLERFPCAVVKRGDEIVAFANLWMAFDRSELSVDLMRYVSGGPRGAIDFLFVELMRWGRTNGYREFCLGMAPLAGMSVHALAPWWHKLGGFAWRHGERFYHFEGLRKYKDKFSPQWRPRYLASPGGIRRAHVMFLISRLIAGGTRQMFSR